MNIFHNFQMINNNLIEIKRKQTNKWFNYKHFGIRKGVIYDYILHRDS